MLTTLQSGIQWRHLGGAGGAAASPELRLALPVAPPAILPGFLTVLEPSSLLRKLVRIALRTDSIVAQCKVFGAKNVKKIGSFTP